MLHKRKEFRFAAVRTRRDLGIECGGETRSDKLLVDRGLAANREPAQAMIFVGSAPRKRAEGYAVGENVSLRRLGEDSR